MATNTATAPADSAPDSADPAPIIPPIVIPDAPVVVAPEPLPTPVDDNSVSSRVTAAIRLWQTTYLTNSPVSRNADSWSHVDNVLGYLVAAILQEV